MNIAEKSIIDLCRTNVHTFTKILKGFHLVNVNPVNEKTWEDLNTAIFSTLPIEIYSTSNGSHSPGADIYSSLGNFSNKTAKYTKNRKSFDVSSYRLTNSCKSVEDFITEINKRKNFDYYSILVREESDSIHYDWLLIPSNYTIFDPSSYTWEPKFSKKNIQTGWVTNKLNGCSMSITFSMSSQLWIHVDTPEITQFIVASSTNEKKPVYSYFDLVDLHEKI